jgi:CRISPR-associated endonuclease Cas2
MQTLVVFDIGDTRLRNRVAACCRDAGMDRTQYSAYLGECTAEVRKRLCERIDAAVKAHAAEEDDDDRTHAIVIQVFPMCAAGMAMATLVTRTVCEVMTPVVSEEVIVV